MISLMLNWNLFELHLHYILHYFQNQNTHSSQILWFLVFNLVSSTLLAILTSATFFFSFWSIYPTSVLPATLHSKSKKKRRNKSSSDIPERDDLVPAPRKVDKSMESDEDCPSNKKQINKQELLFINDNPAPNNPCTQLSVSQLITIFDDNNLILEPGYNKSSQHIALYLTILQKSTELTAKEFQKFKNHVLHFQILDKHLF